MPKKAYSRDWLGPKRVIVFASWSWVDGLRIICCLILILDMTPRRAPLGVQLWSKRAPTLPLVSLHVNFRKAEQRQLHFATLCGVVSQESGWVSAHGSISPLARVFGLRSTSGPCCCNAPKALCRRRLPDRRGGKPKFLRALGAEQSRARL